MMADEKIQNKQVLGERSEGENAEPIAVMKYDKRLWIIGQLGLLLCYWYLSFGTIVPYLTTGDFAEIWPAHEGSVGRKVVFFYLSWVFWFYFPTTFGASVAAFRGGNVAFYQTYVEVRPFIGFLEKRKIRYDNMHVRWRGNRGVALTNGGLGSALKAPFSYWKKLYWQGIGMSTMEIAWRNPKNLPVILEIINSRAKETTKF